MRAAAWGVVMRLRLAAVWVPLVIAASLFAVCAILAGSGEGGREAATIVLVAATIVAALVGERRPLGARPLSALRVFAIEALGAAVLVAGLGGELPDAWIWIGAGVLTVAFATALLGPGADVALPPGASAQAASFAEWRRRTRGWRWSAAGMMLVAVAALLLISHLGSSLRSCEETVATVGHRPVVEECRALGLGDLLPLLLLAVLFLLPDLSSIKIAGLGELQMRQDEVEEKLVVIGGGLGSFIVRDASGLTLEQMEDRLGEAETEEEEETSTESRVLRESGAEAPLSTEDEHEGAPVDRGRAIAELDLLWRRLEPLVRLGERCADPTFLSRAVVYIDEPARARTILLSAEEADLVARGGVREAEELRTLARWASLFEEEIVGVRLVAEAAQGASAPMSTESIRQAVTVGHRLASLLPDGARGSV
jgi:hypothetical protein